MKKRRTNSSYQRSWQDTISSPLEDVDSDIGDFDQDTHRETGHDNVVDDLSDVIEGISDDEPDDFGVQEAVTEDIEDDDDDDDDDDDQTTNYGGFKPFKALAGLDQWRPNSSTANTQTHRNTDLENVLEAIEKEGVNDNDIDNESISTASSVDDISAIINSPSPKHSINDKASPRNEPSKVPSFYHPSFSSYPQRPDTQHKTSQAPSFILDSFKHQHSSYKTHLPIKEGGLASMALNCISQELNSYREWQSSTNIELAKHGSVSHICHDGRLCRLVESWEERGLFFAWCVDWTEKEETERPTTDDPYLCVFSTAYLDMPQHKVVDMLKKAPYLGIWPPWTLLPILVNEKEVFVHIVTRFKMDDPF